MSLVAGHRLGAYEILSPIGTGGMGEVYRARDTRLGREVAIKVLRAERLADESRRRRFVQEARAASALNHPNIVTIHEIESQDGQDFIVMEYLPGKTLNVLMRPRMRLSEVLRIAIPIADALARAHAAGIVHRDLKPANVIVTPDGVVKIVDFGLAKLMAADETGGDAGETMTEETKERPLSGPGIIAGTPGYMSPEQATGRHVDARSDVFAFGSLLYEMVTGRRAFAGGSRAETLAAVTRDQPTPLDDVADAPRDLEKLILRCLRKEPGKRFQYMADVKVELEEIREESESGPAAPTAAARAHGRLPWKPAAALAGVLVGGAGLWLLRSSAPPSPRVVSLTATQGVKEWPTLSPDGKQVAFSWEGENDVETPNSDIWLRIIGSSQARRLTTDPARDRFPSWSPDGRQIAFLRNRAGDASATIHVVSPLGGDDQRVGDFPAGFSQLAWSPDGRWLAAGRARQPGETAPEAGGIYAIPFPNGEPRAMTAPEPPAYDAHPAFSPDGRRLAYASCAIDVVPPCDVVVVDVGGDLAPKTQPRRLARESGTVWGLAWTRDGGTLVYSAARQREKSRLWRVRTSGDSPPERLELAPQGSFAPATVASEDRLAFVVDRTDADIYRFEAGQPAKAVLASPSFDAYPNFSPDGRKIAFQSGRSAGAESEIWLADADGSNPVQLTHGPGVFQSGPRFSPDGRRIAFNSHGDDGFAHIWLIDTAGGSLRRLTHGPFHDGQPIWSRDGQWIYYREDRADGRDIVRIPSAGGSPVPVTHDGALLARLSADGGTLFYTHRETSSPLSSLTLPDGPARRVVDCVVSRSLADGPDGIYYLGCPLGQSEVPLYRLDPASGRSRLLGKVYTGSRGLTTAQGLAVSPDGRTILFSRLVTRISDLMLIENFR